MPQCMPFRNCEHTYLQLRYFEPEHKTKACFINCVVYFLKFSSSPCSLNSTEPEGGGVLRALILTIYGLNKTLVNTQDEINIYYADS